MVMRCKYLVVLCATWGIWWTSMRYKKLYWMGRGPDPSGLFLYLVLKNNCRSESTYLWKCFEKWMKWKVGTTCAQGETTEILFPLLEEHLQIEWIPPPSFSPLKTRQWKTWKFAWWKVHKGGCSWQLQGMLMHSSPSQRKQAGRLPNLW